MNGMKVMSGLCVTAALVGCNETDLANLASELSSRGEATAIGSDNSSTTTDEQSGGAMNGGMMTMDCSYPGNCPGDFPAEFSVNEGSAGFDVVHTGELPYADGQPVGAFRTVCEVSHFAYADPIVYPGQAKKGHLHMFFGNTNTNGSSTYSSLRSSGNGTCRGGIANRSAYWVPALLDGSGSPQIPEVIHVYYKSGYEISNPRDVSVIPDGFKMLVGDSMATAPQSQKTGRRDVYWTCNGAASESIGDCYGELKMSINFHQCSTGELDSADHKSHVAPPSGGACNDPRYPVTLPVITYHVVFKVNGTADWRLSSDAYPISNGNGGYSLHGDWMDGWDPDIKRTWTEHCASNPGKSCGSHILGDGRVIFGSV